MTRNSFIAAFIGEIVKVRRTARCVPFLILVAAFCAGISLQANAQESTARERKLISRVEPEYPKTLERLYIGGVVRLEVVVAPGGSVLSATLIGGNPILGQSAIAAVKQWKYASDTSKTTVVERLEFDPHH
jgi:TonB family protein